MKRLEHLNWLSAHQALKHFFVVLFIFILPLSFVQADQPQQLELPEINQADTIVRHSYYTLKFNDKTKDPDWVAYRLTSSMLQCACKRSNDFRTDPLVKNGSATPQDYRASGYDRGHNAPAADFCFDCHAMSESFFMSNMTPQRPELNRGIWEHLEELVRHWAKEYGTIYIVTGPIFKSDNYTTVGLNHIAVPDGYFKCILVFNESLEKEIAFVFPNQGSKEPLQKFAVSVEKVEEITGINVFPNIPNEQQVEETLDLAQWDFPGEHKDPVTQPYTPPTLAPQTNNDQADCPYWLTISSQKRHNPGCKNYRKTKGRCCNKDEGTPCKICGG